MSFNSNTEEGKRKRAEAEIRQMEIDDLAPVYHLGERLFTSEELPSLYRTWDPYEVTEYFSSDPDYCLVAEVEGQIVGFILATTIEKEGTAWKRYGYIAWMGVDEALQRSNLGRRMYRRLEEELLEEGVRMVMADTQGDNVEAIAFFKAIGFTPRSQHVWLAKTLRRQAKENSPPKRTPPAAGDMS
ncbi:MAG TPA: GNAT family N-acetyltransferase [Dehalococcoidia bacterium]|nr:GNAT family N-acetyltransferase [Dehalococcoidia bacterium]